MAISKIYFKIYPKSFEGNRKAFCFLILIPIVAERISTLRILSNEIKTIGHEKIKKNTKGFGLANISYNFESLIISTIYKVNNTMEATQRSFKLLFGSAIRAFLKQSTKEFENQGLKISPEQHYILRILTQEDSIQSDLAEILQKDKSAIMRHIDQLEILGYVIRVNDATDRRKKHIVITELGTSVFNQGEEIINTLSEKNMEGISDEEITIFQNVLIKLKENAEK